MLKDNRRLSSLHTLRTATTTMLAAPRGKVLTIGVASVLTVILIFLALQESEYSPTKFASNIGYLGTSGQKTSGEKGDSDSDFDSLPHQEVPTTSSSAPTTTPTPLSQDTQVVPTPISSTDWEFKWERDERNLGLSEEQCQAAFPLQYAEIERARDWHASQGGISEDQIKLWINEPDKAHGQIRIMIYDGDVSSPTGECEN